MESIILMVLLGIASTVFQAVIQKNNKKKVPVKNAEATMPKAQPIVKDIRGMDNLGWSIAAQQSVTPVLETKLQKINMSMEPETLMEGMQTEALENITVPEQKNESVSMDTSGVLQEISFSELQRSIIMAEVLGKPKALKKAIR